MLIFVVLSAIAIIVIDKFFVDEKDNYIDIKYTLAIFGVTSLFWSIINYMLTFFIQT
jgi:hypothetical protein